jgi:hypothetical protein
MKCFVSYREITSSSISPVRNAINTNGTTPVDLVGSPAASTQRVIDYLSINNTDTSANRVSISFFDGSNTFRLANFDIAAGEKIEYQEGEGFRVIGNGYSTKTVNRLDGLSNDNQSFNTVVLGEDTVCSTSLANVRIFPKNFELPLRGGKMHYFRAILFYDTNATTTGSRFLFNSLAHGTSPSYMMNRNSLTTTSETQTSTSGIGSPTSSNATSAATTGNVCIIEGFFDPDFDTSMYLMFASEVASPDSVTLKANSFIQYQRLD